MPCAFLPLSFTNSWINPHINLWLSLEFYKWTRIKVNIWVTCTEIEVIPELSWLHSQYSFMYLCQISSVCLKTHSPMQNMAQKYGPGISSSVSLPAAYQGLAKWHLSQKGRVPIKLPSRKALLWVSCPGVVKEGFPSVPGVALSCFVKRKEKRPAYNI